MLRYILAGTLLASFSLGAQAQTQPQDTTLNRTVVVEQEYNPDIMDAAKVNVLPKVEPLTVGKKAVEYDATLMPATHIPAGIMPAYAGIEKPTKALPGYARLGYGSYGDLDVRANYLFALSPKDRLNLTFALDGMEGKLDLPDDGGKWKSFYYRTHAALDYVHAFKKVDLNLAGRFGQSNFNLLPDFVNNKQKFVSGDVHLGVNSTGDELPLQFRAETNLLLYQRQHELTLNDIRESIVRTKADVTGSISSEQTVGVAFSMDNAFYSGGPFENHTDAGFNPYYLFRNDDWKIRLGAHFDMAFGFGKQFRVSPDVTAAYTFADSYTLYAQATGGRLQNDFRRLEMLNPYGQFDSQQDATYEQLNAAVGFKASPASGLWFHLYGGYQMLKNDLESESERVFSSTASGELYAGNPIGQALVFRGYDTRNAYLGGEANYSYKDIVAFFASATYRNWSAKLDGEDADQALVFKPVLEADFRIDVRPISPLKLSLGYRHIARDQSYTTKADPVGNLYVNGSYDFLKGIAVYARINNLLNKEYQYYRGCPAEGFGLLVGVSFRF